jgi:hypothetical protein
MEKKTRIQKTAVKWEEKSVDYWTVQNPSGFPLEYETEEQAKKAEEFLKELNWIVTPITEAPDYSLYAVDAFFKYPMKDIRSKWGVNLLGWEIVLGEEIEELQGSIKLLKVCTHFDDGEEIRELTHFIHIDDEAKKELIKFLNGQN